MSRTPKIILWVLAGFVLVVAAIVIFILTFDWNRARPWINHRVSEAIGREFAINGNLALSWQKPDQTTPPLSGWSRWVPWPRLNAQDITLGNPDAFKPSGNMASVKQITFTLNPLPLLAHDISVPTLDIDSPDVALLRDKDAQNNWTFKSSDQPSSWNLKLGRLILRKGTLQLTDAIQKADIKAEIDTLDPAREKVYGLAWNLKGTFNKAPVSGGGKAGGVLSLQDQNQPYPLQADLHVGKTSIGVRGTLTKPAELAAVDLRLSLSGASMAHLFPLTGVLLPETPPFATEGHLIGQIGANQSTWTYEKFSGKVGASDVGGTLKYEAKKPRPMLSGEIVSNLLRFDDLAPLIGADSNASKEQRGAAERQPSDKVLPVKEFDTTSWGALDADVKLTARKILKQKDLPISDLDAHLKLDDRVLSLTPLNFGIAGGNLRSDIKLDGRDKPMKSQLKLSARRIKIEKLYPELDASKTSFGEINGDAALSATGNSVGAMLGSSNGELKTLVNQGAISKLLLEQMGLNVGNIVVSKLFGDKQVKLHCLAGDFPIKNGVMDIRTFILDTDDALINVEGRIDMKEEQLGLTIRPKSKGLRIISLRSPLYVSGSFKNPDVGVDKTVLALRAGGAVLLGVMAPVAAILPLINVDRDQQADCANLLDEVKKQPVAPAPGKTSAK
ncbi:AsmA family protein [Herbaspirillum lusitanum]|uniref:AsmA family protein n=1 Tax=Herbaspirillum lusitanum TaxID=213312 RepID=A0ABW9AFE5_9BURK